MSNSFISELLKDTTTANYEELRMQLDNAFGKFIVSECIDEDENIILINTNALLIRINSEHSYHSILKRTPCFILDKKNLSIICVFYKPHLENANAVKLLREVDWNKILVTPIYHGITIVIFNHYNKYYICTENSINYCDQETTSSENTLIYSVTMEVIGDKFKLEQLDNRYCHYFIMTHNKLRKQINNGICLLQGNYNKDIIHVMSLDKQTKIEDSNYVIPDAQPEQSKGTLSEQSRGIAKLSKLYFSCMDELLSKLETISYTSKINKKIQIFGYNVYVYQNIRGGSYFTLYAIYSEVYLSLMRLLPDIENIYELYLELYQKNKLGGILPYLSKYSSEVIYRINMSMRTLSKEILNIYHATRKQQNKNLYESITDTYKKIIYNLHGIYIDNRKKDFIDGAEIECIEAKSITVHDVYYYVKSLPFNQLKQLFFDRQKLLDNKICDSYMCKGCIFTLTQTKLMIS